MRSDVVVFAAVSYSPASHVVKFLQSLSCKLLPLLNSHWLLEHAVCAAHTRSDVCVGAVVCHCEGVHVVMSLHSRLLVALGAVVCHCVVEQTVSALHARSDEGCGAAVSHSIAVHTV